MLFLLILITPSSATPAVYIPDAPVTNGILSNSTHVGFSYPEIVIDNGEWTLNNTLIMIISGETVQESIGYEWNGTGFEQNATVSSGITAPECTPEFEIFEYNNQAHYITIDGSGVWHGLTWNGSGWTTNATVLNGLTNSVPSAWAFPYIHEER